jgi:Kef-type K+ transport system membrane component KefB
MEGVLPILGVLFFVYLIARALGEVAERLGLPALVGEIVAGVVIANVVVGSFSLPSALDLSAGTSTGAVNQQILTALADIGVVFLVFAVGLEIRTSELLSVLRISARTATFGILVPLGLGTGFLLLVEGLGSTLPALFVGTAMVVTSLTVTAHFLRDRGLLATREARVILGAAVIEDIAGVVLLTTLVGIAANRIHGPIDLIVQVGVVAAFAVALVGFFLYGAPRIARRAASSRRTAAVAAGVRTPHAALVLAILLCLGASALAASFQLASIVGALFVGMVLAEYRDRLALGTAFEALTTFFVPFFFVTIGFEVSTGDLLLAWPIAAAVTVLAVVGKLAGAAFESRDLGRSAALRVGVGLVPRAEVGIIVAFAAYDAGVLSATYYTAIVLMAVVTAILGPLLLLRLYRTPPAPVAAPAPPDPAGPRAQ